ncbi:MAG TPA: hypothetical protein VGO56_19670, partial [Pyrinomonadaceae bacterium]|nr:hypothetical protein [Pyrinomonadaceae bacterium]
GCSESASELKSACSRTIQNASANYLYARGASPSMRERRINRASLCTISGELASIHGVGCDLVPEPALPG